MTKISNLPQQSSPTTADKIPFVSGGTTDYVTIQDLITLIFTGVPASATFASPLFTGRQDAWITGLTVPSTITYNGNRSYSLVFNSIDYTDRLSRGMRLRLTSTNGAPTQCASLNGTTQYFEKATPAGMTFTDDFVAGAWIKVTGNTAGIITSRWNGTSGWVLQMLNTGQIQMAGYNAGVANFSLVVSVQSIPLNKWVHVASQLDMSAFTATATTSYIMIDGQDVAATVSRGGTNPTALVQAGNYQVGANNGTSFWPYKICQPFVFSAKVTQATLRGYISQTFLGTESTLISAHSLSSSDASPLNDKNTTNANNLTAVGVALTNSADSPFGVQDDGTVSATVDYGLIMSVSFLTNTTVVIQVPEGNTIPTVPASAALSALAYSTAKAPKGMPAQRDKYHIEVILLTNATTSGTVTGTIYNPNGLYLNAPIGDWLMEYDAQLTITTNAANMDIYFGVSTSNTAMISGSRLNSRFTLNLSSTAAHLFMLHKSDRISVAAATPYYPLLYSGLAFTFLSVRGDIQTNRGEVSVFRIEPAHM